MHHGLSSGCTSPGSHMRLATGNEFVFWFKHFSKQRFAFESMGWQHLRTVREFAAGKPFSSLAADGAAAHAPLAKPQPELSCPRPARHHASPCTAYPFGRSGAAAGVRCAHAHSRLQRAAVRVFQLLAHHRAGVRGQAQAGQLCCHGPWRKRQGRSHANRCSDCNNARMLMNTACAHKCYAV